MSTKASVLWVAILASLFSQCYLASAQKERQTVSAHAPGTQPVRLYYTGKLFGYYRMEPNETKPLGPVKAFLEQSDTWKAEPGWLLGMGDNFGPEFGASIQFPGPAQDNPCYEKPLPGEAPRSLYKGADRTPLFARCDNVANFMLQAGYRAIVPGREDLIYTSRWLRTVAQKLRAPDAKASNPDGRMVMLAANLRVISNAKGAKTCSLLFGDNLLGAVATPCLSGANTPSTFDWIDRLDKLAQEKTAKAVADSTVALGEENLAALKGDTKPEGENSTTSTANKKSSVPQAILQLAGINSTRVAENEQQILKAAWGARCGLLDAKNNWNTTAFKATPLRCPGYGTDEGDLNTYWESLSSDVQRTILSGSGKPIQAPPLSRKAIFAAQRQFLRIVAAELKDTGYAVSGIPTEETRDGARPADRNISKVLFVGVVGKETTGPASSLNLQIGCDTCSELTTDQSGTVTVFDPVTAAVMAIRAARAQEFAPFSSVVLMAQMPAPDAEILAARVRARLSAVADLDSPGQYVDVVLSEAQTDYQSDRVSLSKVDVRYTTPVFTPPAPNFLPRNPDSAFLAAQDTLSMSGSVNRLSFVEEAGVPSYVNERQFTAQFTHRHDPTTHQLAPTKTMNELRRLLPPNASTIIPCLEQE
jgi:hypothetical protein